MNVAHCIHGLGLGGAQRIIQHLISGRQTAGLRYLVYSCEDGVMREGIERAGARVRIIPRRIPKLDPTWVARLAGAMRHDAIDLAHTHLFGDALHGYLAARSAGRLPVVTTLHGTVEAGTGLRRLGYRWLLPRCAGVVACSRAVEHSFRQLAGDRAARLRTIANGIEAPAAARADASARAAVLAELGIDPQATVLAAVGRLVPVKGYEGLIRAFASLAAGPGGGPHLVLIGDGPLRVTLARQAERLGVAERVVLTGFRPDVARLLPALDVVVFSSRNEGLSVALLEAMAAGRSIVATDLPGIVEAVRDEREALIVPVDDRQALAAALERASADPALRRRLGAAARRRFDDRFSAQRMVESYEELYREIGACAA